MLEWRKASRDTPVDVRSAWEICVDSVYFGYLSVIDVIQLWSFVMNPPFNLDCAENNFGYLRPRDDYFLSIQNENLISFHRKKVCYLVYRVFEASYTRQNSAQLQRSGWELVEPSCGIANHTSLWIHHTFPRLQNPDWLCALNCNEVSRHTESLYSVHLALGTSPSKTNQTMAGCIFHLRDVASTRWLFWFGEHSHYTECPKIQ